MSDFSLALSLGFRTAEIYSQSHLAGKRCRFNERCSEEVKNSHTLHAGLSLSPGSSPLAKGTSRQKNTGGKTVRPRESSSSRVHFDILTLDPSEQPQKRAKTGTARPPVVVALELKYLDDTKKAAIGTGDGEKTSKNKNIFEPAAVSEARSTVATWIVEAVRERLDAMTHGHRLPDCSVCFTVCGKKVIDHLSGVACPQSICGGKDAEWQNFKKAMLFESGCLCFRCLLPTVDLSVPLTLSPH